jgi:hypothetical protein
MIEQRGMCNACDKLQEAIPHDRPFLTQRFDPLTEERIKTAIADVRAQQGCTTRDAICGLHSRAVAPAGYRHEISTSNRGQAKRRHRPPRNLRGASDTIWQTDQADRSRHRVRMSCTPKCYSL